MPLLPNFSDIRKMISQYDNAELNQVILDLQAQMQEMREETRSLKEHDENLKKKLELSQKVLFKPPFWYAEQDEQPCCPNCKESKDVCPTCHNIYGYLRDEGRWDVVPRFT